MKNKLLQIKSKLSDNKKRAVAWLLVGSMVMGISPLPSFTSNAAEKRGTFLTETNTGDMSRIPYNNDDLIVDLSSGAFSSIVVGDVNEDGYMDLLMGNGTTPYEGNKVFYGCENSQDSSSDEYLLMDKCRRITKNQSIYGTPIYGEDGSGDYERTIITIGEWAYGSSAQYPTYTYEYNSAFPVWNIDESTKETYRSQVVDGEHCRTFNAQGEQVYSYADYDGDNLLDAIWSVGCEADYDLQYATATNHYTEDGVWDPDSDGLEEVQHGFVFWHKNERDPAAYEGQEASATIAVDAEGKGPVFGDPEVVCVYDYTVDTNGKKVIIEDSKKPLDVYNSPQAQFRDWDNDGDLDIICGSFRNEITYFENIGTRTEPVYVSGRNLIALEDKSEISAEHCCLSITSVKWNQDQFFDLIVIEEDGRVFILENTGDLTEDNTPIMKKARYFQQPADNVKVGMMSTPVSVDWDGDGDEDIVSGDSAGFISLVKNLSKEEGRALTDPSWDRPVRMYNPSGKVHRVTSQNADFLLGENSGTGNTGSIQGPAEPMTGYTKISVADWDGDGVLDVVSNNSWGAVCWYRGVQGEIYTLEDPRPIEVEWENGPKIPKWYYYDWRADVDKELITQWRTTPFTIDLPTTQNEEGVLIGDGLIDLVMLDHEGYLSYFERYQSSDGTLKLKEGKRIFKDATGSALRLSSTDCGGSGRRLFILADYNDDGRLDILCDSAEKNSIDYWENMATKPGEFIFDHPETLHSRPIKYHTPGVTACDWNQDKVVDLIVSGEDGHFYYLLNNRAEVDTDTEDPGESGGEEDSLAENLVAHWDFEGDTETAELQDKSIGGKEQNNLTSGGTTGNVTIDNGVATIKGDGYLIASDDPDLDLSGEMTIFMRACVSGYNDGTTTSTSLIQKGNGSDGYNYLIGVSDWGHNKFNLECWTTAQRYTTEGIYGVDTLPNEEWHEIAFVISEEAGSYYYEVFLSEDAMTGSVEDFKIIKEKTLITKGTTIRTNTDDLLIGVATEVKNIDITRQIDDVRIYNKALTTDQLATLLPGPSIDDSLVAHWDFNGDSETACLDKASNSAYSDNLEFRGDEGTVSIQNGIATMTGNGALYAEDTEDLDASGKMTIFMRAYIEGDGEISLINKAGSNYNSVMAYKLTVLENNKLNYCLSKAAWQNPDYGIDTVGPERGVWREIAIVVDNDENEYVTVEAFVSKDISTSKGSDYTSLWKHTFDFTERKDNDLGVTIGNGYDVTQQTLTLATSKVTRKFDDVRIYNTALTTDELATLIPDYKNIPKLVAHWDFEGPDEATQLADKGSGENPLTAGNNVSIADGVATVTSNGYLKAAAAGLNLPDSMTIFVRAKTTTIVNNWSQFVNKYQGGKGYAIGLYPNGNGITLSMKQNYFVNNSMKNDEWREMALVVTKKENGDYQYQFLISKNEATKDGDDFVTYLNKQTAIAEHNAETAELIIGNNESLETFSSARVFDDIQIYNSALTADELAALINPEHLNDGKDTTSYYLDALENTAGFTFLEHWTKYTAETTKESVSFTPIAKDEAAVIQVDGTTVVSGETKEIALIEGENTVAITVGDGTTPYKTYTVKITRSKVPSVDELQSKINEAKNFTQGDYSDSSFAELQTVIASAQAVADDGEATDAERIDAAERLQRAIAGLTSEMRYADLKELVTVAGNLQNTGYQKWADYKKWSEKAQAIVSTKSPYLGEVAEVYAGLENAYNQLMSEESLPAVSLEGFRNVTTWNYENNSGNQMPDSDAYTGYTLYNLTDVEGNQINSLDKVLLSMKVKFAASGGASQLCFAYDGEKSTEFRLYPEHDGLLAFANGGRSIWETIWSEYTSVPHMVNQEFNLQISYEYLDTDGDETDDALRIGFYLNGKLYENRHFVIENCDVSRISSSFGAVHSNDAVTISSLVVAEEDHWNLDNGEYQLGNGDVWVDNETPSGTSLNTVGDYQVAKIAQNNVVNYAILYKTGDANADNTNDVKDLVATLKARAGEKANKRAAVLGADMNGDEIIDEKDTAGIREILLK